MTDWIQDMTNEKYFSVDLIHDLANNKKYLKDVKEWYYNKFVKNN